MSDPASPVVRFPQRLPEPLLPAKRERPRGLPPAPGQPTAAQRAWLACGLGQPGGKLPLFDADGRRIDARTIRACIGREDVALRDTRDRLRTLNTCLRRPRRPA